MCHYQQHYHDNPLIFPGIQDISSHVDFTTAAEAAQNNGLTLTGFTQQATFLMNCGLVEELSAIKELKHYQQASQQIKQLILPSEMGELFKVMALNKKYCQPLMGFSQFNQIERLNTSSCPIL